MDMNNINGKPLDNLWIIYDIPSGIIKQGVLEHGACINDFPSCKPPFSWGIFQPAVFDYQRVFKFDIC